MAANPTNTPWVRITYTSAGTTLVMGFPGNLETITVGTATTGTLTLWDSASVTQGTVGTANQIIQITGAVNSFDLRTRVKNGILATSNGGTIDCTISCG